MTWHQPGQYCYSRNVAGHPELSGFALIFAIIDCNAIIACMASITVRNLEEGTKRKLKVRAAENGRSMEQEVREILKSELDKPRKPKTGAELVKRIRAIWEPLGGVDLELPPREPMRDPDWLKDWK
jgi:antitoxin FitA